MKVAQCKNQIHKTHFFFLCVIYTFQMLIQYVCYYPQFLWTSSVSLNCTTVRIAVHRMVQGELIWKPSDVKPSEAEHTCTPSFL